MKVEAEVKEMFTLSLQNRCHYGGEYDSSKDFTISHTHEDRDRVIKVMVYKLAKAIVQRRFQAENVEGYYCMYLIYDGKFFPLQDIGNMEYEPMRLEGNRGYSDVVFSPDLKIWVERFEKKAKRDAERRHREQLKLNEENQKKCEEAFEMSERKLLNDLLKKYGIPKEIR